MIKQRYYILVFAISIMLCSQSKCGAEEIITLEKAIKIAREANPQMMQARYAIAAARGDLSAAAALPDTEIELEIGGLKPDEKGRREINIDSIGIRQPFDPPGVRDISKKIAGNDLTAQQEFIRSVWAGVYAKVRETYYHIILDNQRKELANENLETARQMFSRVQIRFEEGRALQNDLQRAKIELLKDQSTLLAAEKELKTDKAVMNLLLGRPMETAFETAEKLQEETLSLRLEELNRLAIENNPNLKIERLNLNSKTLAAEREQLRRLPAPSLGFERVRDDFEDDYKILLGLKVPLWGGNKGQTEKAAAEQLSQQVNYETATREVMFEVYQAFLEAQLAEEQVKLYKKSLEEAGEMLRLAQLHYDEGKLDLVGYLDQIRTAKDTKQQYYERLFELTQSITKLESIVYISIRKEGYLQ